MTERIYVRKTDKGHWQWRLLNDDGSWGDGLESENLESLKDALVNRVIPLCVLVPGEDVVARSMPVDGVDKKHLAKLLPYEMEEQLIDTVEDLHFCMGKVENDVVNLLYLSHNVMEGLVENIGSVGDIQHIYPDYLALKQNNVTAVLLMEGERVLVKYGHSLGFSTEVNLIPFILENLTETIVHDGASLRIIADSAEKFAVIRALLPQSWTMNEALTIDEQLGDFWEHSEGDVISLPHNMRSGAFGRQLPFAKWWQACKIPAYFAAAAFVFAFVVSYMDYLVEKNEGKRLRSEIQQVYLQAVPNGRVGDEEKRLEGLLKGSDGSSIAEPTNLVLILGGLAKTLDAQKDVKLSNFRYNGEQRELTLNIEVKGLGELGQFRELLASNGLESGSPRSSKQEEIYQASMKITEKK